MFSRYVVCPLGLDTKRLTYLQPYPSNLTVKPRMLHPLMLLPREHLPLSALDLSQPRGDFPASHLFESNIKILDLEGRLGSKIVLLARSETSRVVYAVEHESNGLYALCKLGSWADIESLSESATVVCRERMSSAKTVKPEDTSVTPLVTPLMHKESKRRRLAMDEIQLLIQRRPSTAPGKGSQIQTSAPTEEKPGSEGSNGQSMEPAEERPQAPVESLSPLCWQDAPASRPAPGDDFSTQPSAEDIFQNIRTQYFEALYHSKVGNSFVSWLYMCADCDRGRWRILQKALSLRPGQLSIWITTPTLRWLIS